MADNIVYGRGVLYFDEFVAGTETRQGFFQIAQTPNFAITSASETLDHFNQDTGIQTLDESLLLRLDRSGNFTAQDITAELAGLFIVGDVSTIAQSATPVVDEAITVQQGLWYQLGDAPATPGGAKNVSSVVIQDVTDTTTYVEGTDYTEDLVNGMIYIIPGGGISDDDVIHVDYTPTAENQPLVTSVSDRIIEGALKFVSNNPKGNQSDIVIPKCQLNPNGEWQLKGDTWQEMPFSFKVLEATGYTGTVYIGGRAVA